MVRASTVPGPVSNWPFVGRSGELATFRTLLADPSSRGVLVYGPAGVGKTRLAEQFATIATGLGRACGRATGSATAATVPLGALAHLLPAAVGRERLDPVALVDRVAEAFRHRSGGAPFVVHADDLHLLDITSLTLLTQLIDAAAVFLIGTVRADEPVPDALSALWRGGRLARIDLTDLSRDGVEELLSAVLRGPVEAATVDDVYSIGRGNILFVRELVLGALDGGRLVTEHGVWRLTGPLASTAALAELVEANLRNVDPAARPVLELLALVGAAGLTGLAAMASADTLESLERAGLVLLRTDRRRQQVSLAHPLYGEVLRDRLPRLTRRRILLEHADRIEAFGARRRGDPLRIATWRLDALGTADPELLLSGARLARYGHDFAQVRRLAGAALAERVSDEGRLLLGEALYELGEFDEAEQMLSAAEQVVPVVATRVRNLTWGLLRPEEALAISRATRARVTDPVRHQELLAAEALAALAALDAPGDRRTAVLRAVPHATALVMTGRCVDGLAVARAGFAEQGELSDQLAMVHPSTHLVIEAYALAEAGDLPGAAERAASGRRLAVRDRSTIGRIWFAYHLGRCALLTGQVRTARRWFAEAVALCRDHGYRWPTRSPATSWRRARRSPRPRCWATSASWTPSRSWAPRGWLPRRGISGRRARCCSPRPTRPPRPVSSARPRGCCTTWSGSATPRGSGTRWPLSPSGARAGWSGGTRCTRAPPRPVTRTHSPGSSRTSRRWARCSTRPKPPSRPATLTSATAGPGRRCGCGRRRPRWPGAAPGPGRRVSPWPRRSRR